MSDIKVPFLDLRCAHSGIENELCDVVRDALSKSAFIGGERVESFERAFAEYCGASHAVGVGSGTDALRFALMASGVSPGDEVITVANTFIATIEAIIQAGAHPVFVDVDDETLTMDPSSLEYHINMHYVRGHGKLYVNRLNGRPLRAIVPVHLYGQCADMDSIMRIANERRIKVVEDACQAHGAQYFSEDANRWQRAGSIGASAAFSFYPGKNLGALGEAGAVTTNDGQIARLSRMYRDHGQSRKYFHDVIGYNGRLDAIQAGFLLEKLKLLGSWNDERRLLAHRYDHLLKDSGVRLMREPEWSRGVYHLYVVRTAKRDALQAHLDRNGVSTGLHYPLPLHMQKCFDAWRFPTSELKVTERSSGEVLSLPMYPGLTHEQQKHVAKACVEFGEMHEVKAKAA